MVIFDIAVSVYVILCVGWLSDTFRYILIYIYIYIYMYIYIYIYIQQDATLHSFILSGNCSTCFGWYHHPSSGAQTTVSIASGICHTVCHPQHTQTSSNSSMIAADSNNGVKNTRCCRYSCLRSWWWVMVPLKTCRAVSRKNKLCNVASCWIYIRILLHCTDPWTLNTVV